MFTIDFLEETASTNLLVKEQINEGAAEGYCACTLAQTAGYGRQGRAWKSPKGGLYFSMLLRPNKPLEQLPSLALVCALALKESLTKYFSLDENALKIKWPNDIVTPTKDGFNKVCGISLELIEGAICVGVGINIVRPSADIETDGRYSPAFLCELAQSKHIYFELNEKSAKDILNAMLDTFSSYYARWLCGGESGSEGGIEPVSEFDHESGEDGNEDATEHGAFACFKESYISNMYAKGSFVKLCTMENKLIVQGKILGVDNNGLLILKMLDGSIESFNSGEVHFV